MFSTVSKAVGWTREDNIEIPPLQLVKSTIEGALRGDYVAQCLYLTWYRFCKSPLSDQEIETMDLLCDNFRAIRDKANEVEDEN
jgi:hypothetical protein